MNNYPISESVMSDKKSAEVRQKAIGDLVRKMAISDQKQLVSLLEEHYQIKVGQAVVSRDLRKMGVVKKTVGGSLCYEMPNIDVSSEILKLALIDITHNESMIVIKTFPALADFVGDRLDQLQDGEILGCVSGENTVFVTPTSTKNIRKIYESLCAKLHFKKKKND